MPGLFQNASTIRKQSFPSASKVGLFFCDSYQTRSWRWCPSFENFVT